MPRNVKDQWRFHTCWREPGEDGALREYAQTFEFADGNTAARAHHSARRGAWLRDGMTCGWVSELRKYEVDMDDAVHRARIVAIEQEAADVRSAA
jgi:hypothetical protein